MSPPLQGSEARCCIVNLVMSIAWFSFFLSIKTILLLGRHYTLGRNLKERWGVFSSCLPARGEAGEQVERDLAVFSCGKEDSAVLWLALGCASVAGEGRVVIQPLCLEPVIPFWSPVSSSGLPSRHAGSMKCSCTWRYSNPDWSGKGPT